MSLKSTASTLAGIDRDVDAAQELLAQTVDAGRAFEVAGAQFAHVDLEGCPRRAAAAAGSPDRPCASFDLERDAELEEARAILAWFGREVDGHLAAYRGSDGLLARLGLRFGRRVLRRAMAAKKPPPPPPAREHGAAERS